jgi:hypothetical protein
MEVEHLTGADTVREHIESLLLEDEARHNLVLARPTDTGRSDVPGVVGAVLSALRCDVEVRRRAKRAVSLTRGRRDTAPSLRRRSRRLQGSAPP